MGSSIPTPKRLAVALVLSLLVVAAGYSPTRRYLHAADFLRTLSSISRTTPASDTSEDLVVEELTLPGEGGPIRARLYYRADRPRAPGLVVAHGVHYRGIDERRLVPFVRGLAREGLVVLTPELAELADYRITESGVSVLRASVDYLVALDEHVSEPRVGLLGFSFAGGLALVAAARPELSGKLSYVTSVGGHQDLSRVLHFLIKNEIDTPHGLEHEKAHDYGLVVLVYGNLERFVPPADLPAMRAGFKAWLEEDRPRARALSKPRSSAEAERLWQLLENEQLQTLAPELDALLAAQSETLAALSPRGHLREIGVPVYLLHGAHDSVIPPSECEWGDLELGSASHLALVTPLIEHVEVSKHAGLGDELSLLRFIARLF